MSPNTTIYIAVTDDHELVRQGLCEMIAKLNPRFQIMLQACNGEELLTLIAQSAFQPDLCLLDISMPVLDGYETMKRIMTTYPHIRVIALTMFCNKYSVLRMLTLGARGFIVKNSKPIEVNKAIIGVYQGDIYLGDEVKAEMPQLITENVRDYLQKLLSDRELEILKWCCMDLSYDEVGEKIHLSGRTVESYCHRLCDKFGVKSKLSLVVFALESGIVLRTTNK